MKTIDELIAECYKEYIAKVYKIYDIFIEQFGEENVDIQDIIPCPTRVLVNTEDTEEQQKKQIMTYFNVHFSSCPCNIYVHWKSVRIINEYNKSTDIQDLWAKVSVYYNGCIVDRFTLNRSTYSYEQFKSNYMHSHIERIPYNSFTIFQRPCTGRGPINNTIESLTRHYDEDLWGLFCCELNNFVSVESVQGIPYHRLENIGDGDKQTLVYSSSRPIILKYLCPNYRAAWKDFIRYVLESKKLLFSYHNGNYELGFSYAKCTIIMSDLFIEWYNKKSKKYSMSKPNSLLQDHILVQGYYSKGCIYTISENSDRDLSNYVRHIGKKVLTFKGKDVLLDIVNLPQTKVAYNIYLGAPLINLFITILLKILNYRYGKPITYTNKTEYIV